MTKATDKIQQLIEEVNDCGLSGADGVYSYLTFSIHHNDIDIVPSGPVKMDLKEAMFITNTLKGFPRHVTVEGHDPVICRSLVQKGGTLDLHVSCSSVEIQLEMANVIAEGKVFLEKYSRDLGFTPGTHHYNVLDGWIPWESVRTVDLDLTEEGWT
jgi:hypothetical protein